jgi:hypothetical protein
LRLRCGGYITLGETAAQAHSTMQELKLIALDAEDLSVLSAHLQDAVLKVGDIAFLPGERRFALLANRFNWPAALTNKRKRGPTPYTRHRCALRFEQVSAARLKSIDLGDKDRVLSMLALQFEASSEDDPSGTITLFFAGDAAIRLDVGYIEAELRDLGGAWMAKSRPRHPEEDGGDAPSRDEKG